MFVIENNLSKMLRELELPKSSFKFPDISRETQRHMQQLNAASEQAFLAMQEERKKEENYKVETLNTLKNIEKNTGDISQLVFLLNANSEKQTEILAIMTEILSIGTSKTEIEAESKYRTVMRKITQTFEDAETMEKLLGYSKMFYRSAKEYIKYRIENG